jgi:hypothetical protein
MNEADRLPENSEHALSVEEMACLRRLLNGMTTNQIEPADPHESLHEAGLRSVNSRLDLTQKVFAGFSLVVMACLGYLLLKTTDVSVSIGKIETRLESIDERFDRVDKRFDTIAAFMTRLRLRQQGLFKE